MAKRSSAQSSAEGASHAAAHMALCVRGMAIQAPCVPHQSSASGRAAHQAIMPA